MKSLKKFTQIILDHLIIVNRLKTTDRSIFNGNYIEDKSFNDYIICTYDNFVSINYEQSFSKKKNSEIANWQCSNRSNAYTVFVSIEKCIL